MPVSQHPKRVEGVFVSAQSPHGELLLTKTFKRGAATASLLSTATSSRTGVWTVDGRTLRSEGNFCNLFGSESPSPVDRRCE
eukprot:6376264-Prymnesium_polylepis.1